MKKILNKLTIMLLAAVMLVSSLPVSAANVADFKDVSKDHWFYDAVSYALTHEMTTGTSETEFSPFKTMTRAEFITLLGRLNGNKDAATHNDYLQQRNSTEYTDVLRNTWYISHVNWADHFGIVDTTGTQFRPHDAITREEMAIFLGKYIEVLGVTLPASAEAPAQFSDAAAFSAAAAPYIELVRECGLIIGDTDGSFRPHSTLNRAEAFTIGMRVRELLQGEIGGVELPRYVACDSFSIGDFPDLKVGDVVQAYISYFVPYDTTETEGITWSSWEGSDHIATITEDGILTAHSEGLVTIYATHPSNGDTRIGKIYVHAQ